MAEHLITIKPSRVKYLSYYLVAVIVFALSIYIGNFYSINRSLILLFYGMVLILLLLPEILRHKDYHKITKENIVEIKSFGQRKRSVLHSFNLDIHVHQNPFLKYIFDIGTVRIESFSGHGITMPHIKNPRHVANMLESLTSENKINR